MYYITKYTYVNIPSKLANCTNWYIGTSVEQVT